MDGTETAGWHERGLSFKHQQQNNTKKTTVTSRFGNIVKTDFMCTFMTIFAME